MTTHDIDGIIGSSLSDVDETSSGFLANSFCCFWGRLRRGITSSDELEIALQGETKVGSTRLAPITTLAGSVKSKVDTRLTTHQGEYLGDEAVNRAKKAALDRDPGCQSIWLSLGRDGVI